MKTSHRPLSWSGIPRTETSISRKFRIELETNKFGAAGFYSTVLVEKCKWT